MSERSERTIGNERVRRAERDEHVILVRYFAGARAAAGVPEEKVAAPTLDALLAAVGEAHGDRLVRVLCGCSFLVDGLVCRDRSAPLAPDAVVDVLPPFAGG